MQKIADDRKPMAGVWYRSTIDPQVFGKVTGMPFSDSDTVEVTFTGGQIDRCTLNEFADSWELA